MIDIRRVVTGHSERGRSFIWLDGPHRNRKIIPDVDDFIITDMWVADGPVADNDGSVDNGLRPMQLEPPPGGSLFRTVEFPPDVTWYPHKLAAMANKEVEGWRGADTDTYSDPRMHRTATIDYIVVLRGEIWAVMEEGETLLRAGDVFIQRGTWHAWHNRSNDQCLIACVMVTAKPVSEAAPDRGLRHAG